MAIQNSALAAAAKQYRTDKAYNPEEGTLTYGGYNTMPKTNPSGASGATSPNRGGIGTSGGNAMTGGGNAMTGGGNTMTGNSNAMTGGGNLQGVRNAMVRAGLNNDLIGFDTAGGYVTYNGQNFLAPDNVTDGVSYASSDVINRAIGDYYKNQGMLGIRDTLNARGINNNRIGWNAQTGMVTIDGRDAFKPSAMSEGTTYAAEKDINRLTDTAYANAGDPIQMVTDYVSNAGLSNAAHWADGKLTVGGIDVPVMYAQGGKAYAKQSDLDRAIEQAKENAGITGNREVVENWKNDYGDRINTALDAILNRKAWDYDPYDDPAYLAYRDAYTREGNRAYQDAYAQMAANTGGYGSSAGMTAAGQQLNYYMQQLGDRIPELEQNSYNRWYNDQQLNQAALESLMNVAKNDYNMAYQANRDALNDTNQANYYDYLRDIDARDYNRDVLESDRSWNMDSPYYQNRNKQSDIYTNQYAQELALANEGQSLANEGQKLANEGAGLANWQTQFQNLITKYGYNSDIPISAAEAEALGLPRKADGTYPTMREMQTSMAILDAISERVLWEQAGRQQMIDEYNISNGIF